MKKIGILLDSTECGKYLCETVSELSRSNQFEIYFLLNKESNKQVSAAVRYWEKLGQIFQKDGVWVVWAKLFFKFITMFEFKVFQTYIKDIKGLRETGNIDAFNHNETVYLHPVFSESGIVVRYTEEDIQKIKELDLDIMIRGNARGIFKGKILYAAKDGIVSFHHGDNRWNRGGPAAFWEVYKRIPSTGFVIQQLTEELDGGKVLFRGNIVTGRCYTENVFRLFEYSNPYLTKLLLGYAASGKLTAKEEHIPFGGTLLKSPTFWQSIVYLYRTFLLSLFLIIRRNMLGKRPRWGIAFVNSAWEKAVLRKGMVIENPPNRFFADPFIIKKDDRTICFVEDYSYKQKMGSITAIEILDKKTYRILGPVITESFHLSFPYIFEYEQEIYMIPESGDTNVIRLYKCMEFPLKWEFQKNIIEGINCVDTIVLNQNGKWYLFTNTKDLGLISYHTDNPISGKWIPHSQNPLVLDSRISRNGGVVYDAAGTPIRCRQKQGFDLYGASLSLAKITCLSPTTFKEEEICEILPDFFPNIKGCHHIHSNGEYTVYDFMSIKGRR